MDESCVELRSTSVTIISKFDVVKKHVAGVSNAQGIVINIVRNGLLLMSFETILGESAAFPGFIVDIVAARIHIRPSELGNHTYMML